MNAKKYISEAGKKSRTRDTVALYLDTELLKQFKEVCGDAPYGRILEAFMRDFIDSAKADTGKKK